MNPTKLPVALLVASIVLILGAIAVVVTEMRGSDQFPWGIHLITIPGVFLVGLVVGWVMREKQAADDRAKADLEKEGGGKG